MNFNLFLATGRIMRATFRSLFRNKAVVFFTIVALALIFFLVVFSSFLGKNLENIIAKSEKKVDIAVFIKPEASEFEDNLFKKELDRQKIAGQIEDYRRYSKEDALSILEKENPGSMQFLTTYQIENPLMIIYELVPIKGQKGVDNIIEIVNMEQFETIIDKEEFKASFKRYNQNIDSLLIAISRVQAVLPIIYFIFIAASFLLIFHSITLLFHSRAQEILIMRFVGAKFSFIVFPFILEAIILALLGFFISLFLFSAGSKYFNQAILEYNDLDNTSVLINPDMTNQVIKNMLAWNLCLFLLFAIFASYFSVQRSINRQEIG